MVDSGHFDSANLNVAGRWLLPVSDLAGTIDLASIQRLSFSDFCNKKGVFCFDQDEADGKHVGFEVLNLEPKMMRLNYYPRKVPKYIGLH